MNAAERVDAADREPVDLERLLVAQFRELADVADWGDEEVAGVELVQDRDRGLPAAHEQRLVLPERGGRLEAEDAALELVGLLDVLEPPGRPQGLRHAVVSTTARPFAPRAGTP